MEDHGRTDPVSLPDWIGRYEVLLPIASGGMATVYLARSEGVGGFERDVALKVTHPHLREHPEFGADLLEEAKLAVRIRHPNVVPVLDVGEDAARLFLVMDYVEGDTLSGLLRRATASGTALPLGVGMRVLCDALDGLHAAHELCDAETGAPLGLVHRDFSPQNILIGLDGMSRLTDFGIARAATRLGHTRTGDVKGKISYMAPEQARAQPLDRRCDIWAGGVMAWEILAGQRLYPANHDDVAMLLKLVTEAPPRLGFVNPNVSERLEAAVAKALTLAVEERMSTALELRRALSAGCRDMGIELAELSEVAAFVQRLAGPRLVERRARAREIRQLRARMGKIARSSREIATPTPTPMQAPTPAPLPMLEAPPPDRDEELPTVAMMPSMAPERAPSFAPAQAIEVERTTTDTTAISDDRTKRLGSSPQARRLAIAAAVGAVLSIGLATLVIVALRSDKNTDDGASPAESAVVAAASSVAAPRSAAEATGAPGSTGAPAASTSAEAVATHPLRVRSDASLASLRVNGRPITLKSGSTELTIDAADGETLALEARSVDGRRATASAAPSATFVGINFGGKSPSKSDSPLLTNPYGKKR